MSHEICDCVAKCDCEGAGGNDCCQEMSLPETGGLKVRTRVTIWLDKDGWPVEIIEGKFISNWIRRLIHSRRKVRIDAWATLPAKDSPYQLKSGRAYNDAKIWDRRFIEKVRGDDLPEESD